MALIVSGKYKDLLPWKYTPISAVFINPICLLYIYYVHNMYILHVKEHTYKPQSV